MFYYRAWLRILDWLNTVRLMERNVLHITKLRENTFLSSTHEKKYKNIASMVIKKTSAKC